MKITVWLLLAFFLGGQAFALPVAPQSSYSHTAQVDEGEKEESPLGLAESFLSRGRFSEARKAALHALAESPDSSPARVVLTKAALATGNIEEAQRYTSELMTLEPNDSDNHALQGMVYMLSGKHQLSVELFKTALELGKLQRSASQRAAYANSLVLAYHQNQRSDLALEACLDFLEQFPQEPDLYLTCSRLHREAEDYQAALSVARDGLKVNPEFAALYASVALAQQALGNKELSEQAYLELKKRDPELGRALRSTLDGKLDDKAELKVRVD